MFSSLRLSGKTAAPSGTGTHPPVRPASASPPPPPALPYVAVVLCGGSGTRLWPASTAEQPKQVLPFFGPGDTLLQKACRRLMPTDAVVVVTSEAAESETREQVEACLRRTSSGGGAVTIDYIVEPCSRSTAPAIAAVCLHVARCRSEWLHRPLVVASSDHLFDDRAFGAAIRAAVPFVVDEQSRHHLMMTKKEAAPAPAAVIVTLGVRPTRPETGYGYIETEAVADPAVARTGVRRIVQFKEKPSPDVARAYVESGRFLWNSGTFVFLAAPMLDELRRRVCDEVLVPVERALHEAVCVERENLKHSSSGSAAVSAERGWIVRPKRDHFAQARDLSIDYAVMETARCGYCIPYEHAWSDVGSWTSVYEAVVAPTSAVSATSSSPSGNACTGDGHAVLLDSTGCLVHTSPTNAVAVVGLHDVVVVSTRNRTLVMRRDDVAAQRVKDVVQEWKRRALAVSTSSSVASAVARIPSSSSSSSTGASSSPVIEGSFGDSVPPFVLGGDGAHRPWGEYEVLTGSTVPSDDHQTKRIVVYAHQRLSLQRHRHRAEHWIVVRGTAHVQVDDDEHVLHRNQSVYIPRGAWYRLSNPGTEVLEVIEVQVSGEGLAVHDDAGNTERRSDDYGRSVTPCERY